MGRTMAYTYEIKEYVPGQSLVMSTAAWVLWVLSYVATPQKPRDEGIPARRQQTQDCGRDRPIYSLPAVTLSNENGPSRPGHVHNPPAAVFGDHKPTLADRRGTASP
jgi:hypothetical protein